MLTVKIRLCIEKLSKNCFKIYRSTVVAVQTRLTYLSRTLYNGLSKVLNKLRKTKNLKSLTEFYLTALTDECDEAMDFSDDMGDYVTSVCLIPLSKTHDEAQNFCLARNMYLFELTNPESVKALLDFSNLRFKESTGHFLHVQGKTREGCSVLCNEKGSFDVCIDLCNSRNFFYCEYYEPPRPLGGLDPAFIGDEVPVDSGISINSTEIHLD
jgi:hypothetical protein